MERASGDNAFEAIDWAVEEMHARQVWMEEHAAPTATNLGEVEDNPFSPVLVIVDEAAELVELGGDGDAKEKKQRRELTRERIGSGRDRPSEGRRATPISDKARTGAQHHDREA